jgi:hypothetical protein
MVTIIGNNFNYYRASGSNRMVGIMIAKAAMGDDVWKRVFEGDPEGARCCDPPAQIMNNLPLGDNAADAVDMWKGTLPVSVQTLLHQLYQLHVRLAVEPCHSLLLK